MEMKAAVDVLSALAQSSRLEVFRHLVQRGASGVAAGQIGEQLGIPPATLSFHLAQLANAGLVQARREGRSIIYSAAYEVMNDLIGFLTEKCCAGDATSCAVKSVGEKASGKKKTAVAAHR